MSNTLIEVRVESITAETADIRSYDLRPANGGDLPPFTAGAHIDLHLRNNTVRSYSLLNPQSEQHRYVIAVALDRDSRGGSSFIHHALRVGDCFPVSMPRNNFRLAEAGEHSVLIAGGIGITPLWCMVQRLRELNRSWELYYCTRTRQATAFYEALSTLPAGERDRVHFNFDEETDGRMLDLAGVLKDADPACHYYCCGPVPMLIAFEAATASLPRDRVHVEYFTAKDAPVMSGGFTVVLARSERTIAIPQGKSILDALLEAGIDVPHACTMGTCATCETRVLDGVPDHRDVVLSPEEKASNEVMMICCSGCIGDRLVLDR